MVANQQKSICALVYYLKIKAHTIFRRPSIDCIVQYLKDSLLRRCRKKQGEEAVSNRINY